MRTGPVTIAAVAMIAGLAACGTAAPQAQATRASDVTSTSVPPVPGHGDDGPILDVPTTLAPPQLDIPGVHTESIDGGCTLKVTVDNDVVGFAVDSAAVSPEGLAALHAIAAHLDGAVRLDVAGFASSEGRWDHNVDLSRRRAQSVAEVLGSLLPSATLHVDGYGPDRPVADNATEEGRRQNRRVEITATSRGCAGSDS
jgi:outer membrane protein OmpA-like peptidoglycan-associated protein